jgi:hypothetical protein
LLLFICQCALHNLFKFNRLQNDANGDGVRVVVSSNLTAPTKLFKELRVFAAA